MNAITKPSAVATRPATKLEAYMFEVLPPMKKAEIARALPAHVPMARFERNLSNCLMQNPDLMKAAPHLIYREVSKIAALGLYCDPQLGEAYLIMAWNGKTKQMEPQARIGYRGLMKLGRQSGDVSTLYAHEVHANDEIECHLGADKKLIHKPLLFGERGPIIGYYAVVKYKDGETDFEPMTLEQVHGIRERSDGWKAFKAGKIKSTPWSTDESEMGKKTAMRRLCKRIPQSPDLADAWKLEDAADAPMVDVTPDAPRLTASQVLAQMPDDELPTDKPDDGDGGVTDIIESDGSPAADASEGAATTSPLASSEAPALDFGAPTMTPADVQMAEQMLTKQIGIFKTRSAITQYLGVEKAETMAAIKAADPEAWQRIHDAADLRKESTTR